LERHVIVAVGGVGATRAATFVFAGVTYGGDMYRVPARHGFMDAA
jgi:hypothetical protein